MRHEPGSGEINYPFLFDLLDRLGYDGWVGCEYILADQYLLMERGEFIMRGRGETMPQDGVREALAV